MGMLARLILRHSKTFSKQLQFIIEFVIGLWYHMRANGPLAQLGERILDVDEVSGSSPLWSTINMIHKRLEVEYSLFKAFFLIAVVLIYQQNLQPKFGYTSTNQEFSKKFSIDIQIKRSKQAKEWYDNRPSCDIIINTDVANPGCPYGYDNYKSKNAKGYKLKINEEHAEVLRLIHDCICETYIMQKKQQVIYE